MAQASRLRAHEQAPALLGHEPWENHQACLKHQVSNIRHQAQRINHQSEVAVLETKRNLATLDDMKQKRTKLYETVRK